MFFVGSSRDIWKFYASAFVGDSSNIPVYWLAFMATIQPLGFSTYVISSGKLAAPAPAKQISYPFDGSQSSDVQVGLGNLKLVYSGNDGKLMQYINRRSSLCSSLIFNHDHPMLVARILTSVVYWEGYCDCFWAP